MATYKYHNIMIVVVGGWVSQLVSADVNFFNAPDWSGASLWQWFWRSLYCLYRLVSALADTRQLYIHSQCTCSTCVHIIYPRGAPELWAGKILCCQSLG